MQQHGWTLKACAKWKKPDSKIYTWDFPGGAVVKNPPATSVGTGLSSGPGISHMSQSNKAHAPQLPSLCSRAREPQLPSPRATTTETRTTRACALQQEKPRQAEARAPHRRVAPTCHNLRKPACSNKDPMQPKINKLINFLKIYTLQFWKAKL